MKRENKIYLLVVFFLTLCLRLTAGSANDMMLRCRATGLPILHIETVDSVMPTCEVVEAPPGCDGRSIINNEKVGARLWVEEKGDTIYDSGTYVNKKSGLTIKVRGNTSASGSGYYGNKKPYKLKLQKKADLLFRGNDATYADKDWILLRYVICETLGGNMANRALQMPWAPAEKVVLLFLNGDFRGMYLLTESFKRNTNCRINISDKGFLYEYDAYWWNSSYYIESPHFRYNYTLKYPEEEDILPWQETYLKASISQVEDAYLTKDAIDKVIDVHSYARWLWVHDMVGTFDAGGSNLYLSRYDTLSTSKTEMSCPWDFGASFSDTKVKKWSSQHDFWCFSSFFKLPQTSFIKEYVNLYDKTVVGAFDLVADQLDALRASQLAASMDLGQKLDDERWQRTGEVPTKRMEEMATYLRNRKTDISTLMAELKASHQDLFTTPLDEVSENEAPILYFDILGRRMAEPSTGVTIVRYANGRSAKQIQTQKY